MSVHLGIHSVGGALRAARSTLEAEPCLTKLFFNFKFGHVADAPHLPRHKTKTVLISVR